MGRITRHKKSRVGYKKVRILDQSFNDLGYAVVELEIPAGVRVHTSTYTSKRRCDSARVTAIENYSPAFRYCSVYDGAFCYVPGELVEPTHPFTEWVSTSWHIDDEARDRYMDNWMTCASGIHYFETKKEAANYAFN